MDIIWDNLGHHLGTFGAPNAHHLDTFWRHLNQKWPLTRFGRRVTYPSGFNPESYERKYSWRQPGERKGVVKVFVRDVRSSVLAALLHNVERLFHRVVHGGLDFHLGGG